MMSAVVTGGGGGGGLLREDADVEELELEVEEAAAAAAAAAEAARELQVMRLEVDSALREGAWLALLAGRQPARHPGAALALQRTASATSATSASSFSASGSATGPAALSAAVGGHGCGSPAAALSSSRPQRGFSDASGIGGRPGSSGRGPQVQQGQPHRLMLLCRRNVLRGGVLRESTVVAV